VEEGEAGALALDYEQFYPTTLPFHPHPPDVQAILDPFDELCTSGVPDDLATTEVRWPGLVGLRCRHAVALGPGGVVTGLVGNCIRQHVFVCVCSMSAAPSTTLAQHSGLVMTMPRSGCSCLKHQGPSKHTATSLPRLCSTMAPASILHTQPS
jgi:hypothetical protein